MGFLAQPTAARTQVVFDTAWDVLAYVGYDPTADAAVVVFRGTDSANWGNWINNLKTWRQNQMYPIPGSPRALVHAGAFGCSHCERCYCQPHQRVASAACPPLLDAPIHMHQLAPFILFCSQAVDTARQEQLQRQQDRGSDGGGLILIHSPIRTLCRPLIHAVPCAGFYRLWTASALQANVTRAVQDIMAAHPKLTRLHVTGARSRQRGGFGEAATPVQHPLLMYPLAWRGPRELHGYGWGADPFALSTRNAVARWP